MGQKTPQWKPPFRTRMGRYDITRSHKTFITVRSRAGAAGPDTAFRFSTIPARPAPGGPRRAPAERKNAAGRDSEGGPREGSEGRRPAHRPGRRVEGGVGKERSARALALQPQKDGRN